MVEKQESDHHTETMGTWKRQSVDRKNIGRHK